MRIFISKSAHEVDTLLEFGNKKALTIDAQALIELQYNENFQDDQQCQWICFGSKNAVEFYVSKFDIKPDRKIACVGAVTAQALENRGYPVNFVGEKSGHVQKVAEDLKQVVGSQKCFFPMSDISLSSLHQYFPEDQKSCSILYHTSFSPKKIEAADLYVFTSPSNFESFVKTNQLRESDHLVAWGSSTREAIKKNGLMARYTLATSQIDELITYLSKLPAFHEKNQG